MRKFPGNDETDGVWMSWWAERPAKLNATHEVALWHGMTVTYPSTNEPWGLCESTCVILTSTTSASAPGRRATAVDAYSQSPVNVGVRPSRNEATPSV